MELLHVFELKIIVGSKFSPLFHFLRLKKISHFAFFRDFLKKYDGNDFEKKPPEMNLRYQF